MPEPYFTATPQPAYFRKYNISLPSILLSFPPHLPPPPFPGKRNADEDMFCQPLLPNKINCFPPSLSNPLLPSFPSFPPLLRQPPPSHVVFVCTCSSYAGCSRSGGRRSRQTARPPSEGGRGPREEDRLRDHEDDPRQHQRVHRTSLQGQSPALRSRQRRGSPRRQRRQHQLRFDFLRDGR